MGNNKKLNFWAGMILVLGFFIFMFWVVSNSSSPSNTPNILPTPSQKKSIYKINENDLKIVIGSIPDIEFVSLDVEMLDVRYALQRVIDKPIYELPFYAIKDTKSEGYIGVIVGLTGEALFLIPPKAINETEKVNLEKSIKAINGTAKTFNNNLQLAGNNYDPFEILNLINE
ncbi:hypothetical protein L6267_00220 [Candidatus Parcubacteria bacterium]|nr:hypothetical protein [Candidatus Parcubacteria bacterium]